MNYLGYHLLMLHIDQFLDGRAPGGPEGMAAFFKQHHVRPHEVVDTLMHFRRGDAQAVRKYVEENPALREWYTTEPTLTATGI